MSTARTGQLVDSKTDESQVRNTRLKPVATACSICAAAMNGNRLGSIGVENALGKFCNPPLGGAYIGQGTTMSLGATAALYGIPVPGTGHSIYAGITLKC